MAGEASTQKSSLRNNLMVFFFLIIIIWGILITEFFQYVLQETLSGTGLDEAVIKKITVNFTTLSTGVTIAGTLIVLVIALLLSKTITDPIKKLIDGVAEVAKGNFSTRIEVTSQDELGQLARGFNHMTNQLEELLYRIEAAKKYTDNIVTTIPSILIVLDSRMNVLSTNMDSDKLKNGTPSIGLLQFVEPLKDEIKACLETGEIQNKEIALNTEGAETPLVFSAAVSQIELEEEIGVLLTITDITEQKLAQERIKASLKEKEVLLKEVHHRVKNNLQVISSLLSLQAGYVNDKQALELFKESQNRVRSMAIIHERLYQSKDLGRIDFRGYVRDLADNLFRSYGVDSGRIMLNVNVDNVFLGVDMAIPCGLIVNELVSNSLKYAFPEGRKGEIRIDLFPEGEKNLVLIVKDNGIGFPEELDFRNTETLGLQLVNTLTEQVGGTITLSREGGTMFKIVLPN
jgi:two-component sensor histidine kinase/HAMP domain-containing protein